jgi:hypothetical protein
MDVPTYISNHQAVVDLYGHWPSFHDANVVAYIPQTPETQSLGFTLHTWQMTDELDDRGFFILRKHALVSFRFNGIYDSEMDTFAAKNILFGMKLFRLAMARLFAWCWIPLWICPARFPLAKARSFPLFHAHQMDIPSPHE